MSNSVHFTVQVSPNPLTVNLSNIPSLLILLDFVTSISGSASAISNVGPGLGDIIGPNGNFSDLPNFSKLSLSLGMLLGRLELFAVLVLFFPAFWKN